MAEVCSRTDKGMEDASTSTMFLSIHPSSRKEETKEWKIFKNAKFKETAMQNAMSN